MKNWDQIGIAGEPGAQDEFDGYIGGVYRFLANGASDKQIMIIYIKLKLNIWN